ncbi:MAG: tetratricopeptide repeat protein [Chitinophagaceae bacterium]
MSKILLFFCLLLLGTASSYSQDSTRGFIVKQHSSDTIQRSFALVVGISSYPNINRLLYADDDAYLFSDYLVNQKICEKKDVTLLIDSVATKANFFKELRKILDKTGTNDRIFIYFAGHGDVENDIESGFLLTYNCEPNNYPATDAIDISMLEKFVAAFTKKNTKVVLITDACRSGNLAGGMTGASSTITSLSKGFQNVIKILSCQPNQLSQEKNYPGGGHGVFTYHLIDGLSGLADRDNDHKISLRELDRYLDEVGSETGQQQVPKTDGDPQAKIASFSDDLKMALLARKDNRSVVAVNKKRGTSDSTWTNNIFFQAFDQHIRKLRLTEPEKNNAYYTITEAEKANQPTALVEEMKLELAAVLEDEAQKFINTYLRGKLDNDPAVVLRKIVSARNYLVTVEKIIGEKDFRYNEIHVKRLFLDAYYIFKQTSKSKYPEALAYLETANELLHNQAWICNAMGLFYERLNQPVEAEKSYKKAAELAPFWSYPWNNLGMFYRLQTRYTESETAYEKSILLDSTYGAAWNGLGTLFFDVEKYPEAEEAYKKSMILDPYAPQPWRNLGLLLEKLGNKSEAEDAYRQSIRVDSTDSDAWYNLGNLLNEEGRNEEALEYCKKTVYLAPDDADNWNLLGVVYYSLNQHSEAELAYKKAIRFDSANIYPWRNLGVLYSKLDKYPESAVCFKKVVLIDPSYNSDWTSLFRSLENAGLGYEKIEWYKKKYAHFPDDVYIAEEIATLYLERKDYPNSELYFIKAIEIYPESAWRKYKLASLYAVWDKKTNALQYLEIALKDGFDGFGHLETNPDWDTIRKTPAFIALIEKYKKH